MGHRGRGKVDVLTSRHAGRRETGEFESWALGPPQKPKERVEINKKYIGFVFRAINRIDKPHGLREPGYSVSVTAREGQRAGRMV